MSGQVALIFCKLIASNLRSNVWKYDHHHIIWTLDLSPNGKKKFSVLLSLSKPFDAADIFLTYIFFSFRTSLCWRRLLWGELRWGIFGSGHQKFRTDLVGYVHIFLENSGRRYDFIFFTLILLEHDKLLAGISKPYGVWKSQKKYHSTLRAKRDTFTS